MKLHELKTWPGMFDTVWTEEKTFEVRKNDRDYQVGDFLWLREWEPSTDEYSGRELVVAVLYILDTEPWVKQGYCIMSIREVTRIDNELL